MADESVASSATPTPTPMPEPAAPTTGLPRTEVIAQQWKARIDRADARRKTFDPWWDEAMKSYAPSVTDSPQSYRASVRTNRNFTLVERKSAELFYQRPDVQIVPSPLLETVPQGDDLATAHAAIVNEKLGLDGVDVKSLARQAIFDYLITGGGWTVMGYRAHKTTVKTQVVRPDPTTGLPVRVEVDQPVIVKSECFWENISPKQVLVPGEWSSTKFDKAPWLGWRFELSLTEAKRVFSLPENFSGSSSGRPAAMRFDHGDQSDTIAAQDLVCGVQLWYRSSVFRDDIVHPDHLTELVLIDGVSEPAVHRNCPLQSFDEQYRLTPDSLIGFPIHPLVIRTQTDAAFIMSDAAISLPLVQELDKFRDQMVRQRDGNLLKWLYDTEKLSAEDAGRLAGAPMNAMIGLSSSAFEGGSPLVPVPHGPYPRENFEFNNYLDNDLARTHAIDATSSGTSAGSGLTATEANLRQANVNVRLGWEQGFVADWFVRGVTKFSSILQKFLDVEQAAAIVGQAKASLWDQWRQALPARLSFMILPDSSLRNDTPLDRKQLQDVYTFLAPDKSLNRAYLNRKLLLKYHLDPAQAILKPDQIPQPQPEPTSPSLSFKGEDLNPLSPQSPIVLDILSKTGLKIDPAAIQNAMLLGQMAMAAQQADAAAKGDEPTMPAHEQRAAELPSLSKHQVEETGGMQGSGMMTPMMGGPAVQ